MTDTNNVWDEKVNDSFASLAEAFDKEVTSFPTIEETFNNNQEQPKELIATQPELVKQPVATQPVSMPEPELVKQPIPAPKANNPQEFLKNMTFDLNSIQLVDASPIEEINNFEFVLNNKAKTQIVANQSNYIAYMEALNYNEISALTNSTLDDYASQVLLAQTVHSKVNTTSIGKLDFPSWAKITSHYDIDSFLYGIYIQTFPGDTKFTITCGHCKEKIEATVNNDTLIAGKNESSYTNLQELLNNHTNPKALLDKALVNVTERILLPESKIIMDIKLPTIKKHLDLVGSVNKNLKEKTAHILSLMIFIENTLMIDVKQTMSSGKPCYYKITEREKLARIISQISFVDAKAITEAIGKMIEKYAVDYKIKSFKCPKCQKDLGDIPVDMETLLFYQILQL